MKVVRRHAATVCQAALLLVLVTATGCGGSSTSTVPDGATAPDIRIPLLEGGEFHLQSQLGQQVIMLDFWATWCGPCVQELPILAEVANEYSSRGVLFCAVNVSDDAATIRQFLSEQGLSMTVGLDTDGAAAAAYSVGGIPTLVLIDPSGVVRATHVGFSPDIGNTLRSELDELLAGGVPAS